jgi:hypothetical protein
MGVADTGHTRVLDLDLDLFVHGVAHHVVPRSGERLSDDEYPVWDVDDAIAYLRTTCLLDGPLPGCAVEHHGELFDWWRDGIQRGQLVPPFDVAHLDAHADLGEGESSWSYLLREVLFWDLERRQYPKEGEGHLTDGSYLAFAVACHWVAKVDYVYCPGGGSDLSPMVMEGFDGHGDHVHLAPISKAAYRALMGLS